MESRTQLQLPPSTNYGDDAANEGKYKTCLMYNALRGACAQVDRDKILLNNRARPRPKFTLWMGLWKKLPTKDKVAKFGVNVDLKCYFYYCMETMEHSFF